MLSCCVKYTNVLDSLRSLLFIDVDADGVNISLSEGSMQSSNGARKRQRVRNSPPSLSVREGKAKIVEQRSGTKWRC